ncbi:AEC family transporter [Thiofilum flexile]|uniref:AEC family transporter n=1 Tax=Thiofilum flexile TaxID=125627 RepID=UPI00035C73DC|nr:AEC family transporter [Thiofilum flexile]
MLELMLRILGIIFPVFACAGIGAAYGYRFRINLGVINQINMDVFTPLLIFWVLIDKPFAWGAYVTLALAGTVVVLGSGLVLLPLVWLFKINAKTFLPPMMFNNSGNMGLPLMLFAFGETALQAGVVLFLVEMILHFTVGMFILDHRTRPWTLLKMPMIQATILGLIFSTLHITLPAPIANTLKLMGQVAIPLMLFALGVRLLDINFRDWKLGVLGAFAAPLSGIICALAFQMVMPLNQEQFAWLLLFAALPPAVLNVLVSERYKQEPEKVASIVLIANLGSLIAIPLTLYFALPH